MCPPDDGVGSPGVVAYGWSMPLIDPDATPETRAVLRNLAALEGRHVLFGHQDDLACGTTWSREPGRSDVLEVAGAYPAVLGFDLGHIEKGATQNLDGLPFDDIVRWVRQAHAMGSLVTVSWHSSDLVSGGSAWTQAPTIRHLLPGGLHEHALTTALDRVADFLTGLVDASGRSIPVVFRPWHEHTGDWFWWGRGHNDESEFVALWRHTVQHLRDRRGLHHLLYAISPDRAGMWGDLADAYLYGYPGDDYVDILGLDDYVDLGHPGNPAPLADQLAMLVQSLATVARLARQRGKLAALTEVGVVRGVPDPWTGHLLPALAADDDTRRILWALPWRNQTGAPEHAFTPSPGDPTAADFAAFAHDPFVLLNDQLPDLYH